MLSTAAPEWRVTAEELMRSRYTAYAVTSTTLADMASRYLARVPGLR